MSNEKQDLINHKLTATACKNYTDKEIKKAKDELKTFFSKNIVNTDDHTNELAYQITAPSGAKLLQLQAIGGNSVKYEPSVASDDTTALVKTMPETVYDFDVNKVKGVSEVSENLIVLQDIAETTDNGLTFSVSDGVLTINGTAISNFNFGITLSQKIQVGTYSSLINISGTTTATGNWVLSYSRYEGNLFNLGKTDGNTVTSTTTQEASILRFYVGSGTVFTNYKIKVMLVKGTTAPTEFKVGYEGIHNNELTGFKVEGANLFSGFNTITPLANPNVTYYQSFTYTNDEIVFKTLSDNTSEFRGPFFDVNSILKVGETYTVNCIIEASVSTTLKFNSSNYSLVANTPQLVTNTFVYTGISLYAYVGGISNTVKIKNFMINHGSNALPYVPYIAPATIPINLTSIVDSSGNKLFEDGSLKGINDVYDEITPYKAVKRFGIVDLGSLDWISAQTEQNGIWRMASFDMTTVAKPALTATTLANILCTKYEAKTANNTYSRQIGIALDSAGNLYVYDENYNTADSASAFKTAMSGVYLVYELATPIEANIDLSQLKSIQGHSNGSITALNTYDMPVPSEIRYNSIIQDTLVDSITIEGANMINPNTHTEYSVNSRGTYSVSDDTITIKNTSSNNTNYGAYIGDVLEAGTYYYKFVNVSGLANATNLRVVDSATAGSENTLAYLEASGGTFTIANNGYFRAILQSGLSMSFKVIISKTNVEYRPYKHIVISLPTQTSDGYGVNANAHNLRVFSDYEGNEVNKRYTNVDKVDMGDYNWAYDNDYNRFYATIQDLPVVAQRTVDLLANNYTAKTNSEGIDANWDMVIYNSNLINNVYIHDHRYNDATIFKTAKSGEPMYYPLADTSKTETDLDSFDYFFDVEEGDTITFNNPYAQQVYATYSFIIKEVKSNE